MIRLYAKFNPFELMVRCGRTYASMDKALARAASLASKAVEVEVRVDAKPRSKNLLAIFSGGGRRVAG